MFLQVYNSLLLNYMHTDVMLEQYSLLVFIVLVCVLSAQPKLHLEYLFIKS